MIANQCKTNKSENKLSDISLSNQLQIAVGNLTDFQANFFQNCHTIKGNMRHSKAVHEGQTAI